MINGLNQFDQDMPSFNALSIESSPDLQERNIEKAAQALAAGELVVMQLYTLGFLVDGTNEAALQKLFAAKQINYEKALKGDRPIVSIVPLLNHRQDIIDWQRHHPEIHAALQGNEKDLLTPAGHSLFYRVHVTAAKTYLRAPLIAEDQNGNRSMVLLWHDNPYLKLLEEKARDYKGGEFLLTGSSANVTGKPQPSSLEDLDPTIWPLIATTVDLRDEHILSLSAEVREGIPIINLLEYPPTILRASRMYEPNPSNASLQRGLKNEERLVSNSAPSSYNLPLK